MMKNRPAGFSPRRAFTLLELLLVLLLMGISAATIVPQLNGTLGRWQLRETARNLQTALQVASQWARVRQETAVFALDVKRNAFSLRSLEGGKSAGRAIVPTGRQSLGRGVAVVRMEGLEDAGDEKVLVFRPNGTSRRAMILLTGEKPDANRQTLWQITVDGRGAVRCQERRTDEMGR